MPKVLKGQKVRDTVVRVLFFVSLVRRYQMNLYLMRGCLSLKILCSHRNIGESYGTWGNVDCSYTTIGCARTCGVFNIRVLVFIAGHFFSLLILKSLLTSLIPFSKYYLFFMHHYSLMARNGSIRFAFKHPILRLIICFD